MRSMKTEFHTIDEYIGTFPKDVQLVLQKLREIIRKAAPGAEEAISYQIPTFKLHGNLVHFAAWKNHIGFYPTSSGVKVFKEELSRYEMTKGSIHFPLDKPLPVQLISKLVKYRVMENLDKHKSKSKRKK